MPHYIELLKIQIFVHFARKQQRARYLVDKRKNDSQMMKFTQHIPKAFEEIEFESGEIRERIFAE